MVLVFEIFINSRFKINRLRYQRIAIKVNNYISIKLEFYFIKNQSFKYMNYTLYKNKIMMMELLHLILNNQKVNLNLYKKIVKTKELKNSFPKSEIKNLRLNNLLFYLNLKHYLVQAKKNY